MKLSRRSADLPRPVLDPDKVEMMRAILADYCREHALELESPEASKKAQELVDWIEFGIRNPDELARMIRPI